MINFIVCDDDERYMDLVNSVITKCMMKNEVNYDIHKFNDYNRDFMNILSSKLPSKVYVLDIETPTRSGIDIARIIRNKDINSVIIFLTGHEELSQTIMKSDFLFLSFINKFDNCENRLRNALEKALKLLEVRKNIKFKDSGVIYTINLDDILYITRDSVARKSIVKTDCNEFKLNKNLNEMKKILDDNFIQTHRACIVNKKRVASYNKSKRLITFDNGETTDIVSNKFDEELV